MYNKKILSLSATVAILSTGALAFDSNSNQDVLRAGGTGGSRYLTRDNNSVDTNKIKPIKRLGGGELGDALIFPAFFGGTTEKNKNDISNWSSEFSVVNTSDKAIVAKVVLYGKINSEELRDFNIYLSAHDVFRATLKNGRLISTDGSTLAKALPTKENVDFEPSDKIKNLVVIDEKDNYKYDYDAIMASKTNELNITIDPDEEIDESNGKHMGVGHGLNDFEHDGYIVVYAMAEASKSYHKKNTTNGLHKELWEDYRHLIDTCRNSVVSNKLYEWKDGIQDGIYSINPLYLPNINTTTQGKAGEVVATEAQAKELCGKVFKSVAYDENVTFKSPSAKLTGSILISTDGSDGRGTRDMLLKAYAIDNFTDKDQNQILLWTEGEFAHIADRCLDKGPKYNKSCVEKDASQFNLDSTYYEYTETDPNLSKLIVTQPYKRILVQFGPDSYNAYGWHSSTGFKSNEFGEFSLEMDIYNDDENSFHPTFGNFIVSPATAGSTKGIPYEVSNISLFATMNNKDKAKFNESFKEGYALIKFKDNITPVSGIVTQMSAHINPTKENPANAEVNWIYPYTEYK